MRRAALAALAAVTVVAGACGRPTRTPSDVVTLVPGPVTRYARVEATGPAGAVVLTGDALARSAPILAGRAIPPPASLADFGLDHPRAHLHYDVAAGGAIDLDIGGPSFDDRAVYVARPGDRRVFLVFVDAIEPVLDAAGVPVRQPEATSTSGA